MASAATTDETRSSATGTSRKGVLLRIFLTVWLVYGLHFATDIVRETYLAMTLAEDLTIDVEEYLGLHPDLFAVEDRGAYINNNPGASMLGAIPYALARPAIETLLWARPALTRPKEEATYDDPRPNRRRFFQEVRSRGLDVRFGLAAASMHVGLMAPLGGLAAVAIFLFFRRRLDDPDRALWLALLYAFGTPIFFRSGYLNQNAIVAHAVLFAFVLLAGAGLATVDRTRGRRMSGGPALDGRTPALVGFLAGIGVLCDYSALPFLLGFGIWVVAVAYRGGAHPGGSDDLVAGPGSAAPGAGSAVRAAGRFVAGASIPLGVLLAYQWVAFGNPFLPAQSYMPATRFSVRGWFGLSWPSSELLWRNLLDPAYGLFVFCPLLVASLFFFLAPGWRRYLTGDEAAFAFGSVAALWLFSSANQYGFLQWNTGIRYMVPAVPLLFVAAVPALLSLPRLWQIVLVVPTVVTSWSVAMVREDVPSSVARVLLGGFELPWLTVLRKTAPAYAPFLEEGASPLPLFCLLGVLLWFLWRTDGGGQDAPPAPSHTGSPEN